MEWLVGAFYSRQHQVLRFPNYEPQFPALVEALFNTTPQGLTGLDMLPGGYDFFTSLDSLEKQSAGFGELSYHVYLSGLTLTAGVRVSRDDFSYATFATGPINFGTSQSSGTERSTPVTPKAAISCMRFNPDQLLYVVRDKGISCRRTECAGPRHVPCKRRLTAATGGVEPKGAYSGSDCGPTRSV